MSAPALNWVAGLLWHGRNSSGEGSFRRGGEVFGGGEVFRGVMVLEDEVRGKRVFDTDLF